MRSEGRQPRTVMATWLACALLLTLAVILGRGLAGGLSDEVLAVALGFAGGRRARVPRRHADARGLRARSAAQRPGVETVLERDPGRPAVLQNREPRTNDKKNQAARPKQRTRANAQGKDALEIQTSVQRPISRSRVCRLAVLQATDRLRTVRTTMQRSTAYLVRLQDASASPRRRRPRRTRLRTTRVRMPHRMS
jgi:hypothetical protein